MGKRVTPQEFNAKRELVESVIDKDYSRVYDSAPTELIVRTDSFETDCSYEIEIYDYFRE